MRSIIRDMALKMLPRSAIQTILGVRTKLSWAAVFSKKANFSLDLTSEKFKSFVARLIQNSNDTAETTNLLLATIPASDSVMCALVGDWHKERNPLLITVAQSASDIHPSAMKNILQLFAAEYTGAIFSKEELMQLWNDVESSEYKRTKQVELYFLSSAIKSNDIEVVEDILQKAHHISGVNLSSTYKIGILRLVSKVSPGEYSGWKQKLKLTKIEELQSIDIDLTMHGSTPPTHQDIEVILKNSVPKHLRADLEMNILPFYDRRRDKMKWMECRINPKMKRAFIDEINNCLVQQKPFSLIRLGDGESYAWPEKIELAKLEMRESIWWGVKLEPKHRKEIASQILHGISNATVLGIPSVFRFARDTSIGLESYSSHRSVSGLLAVLNGLETIDGLNCSFTEDRIHQVCFDFDEILNLAKNATKVVLVSSLKSEYTQKIMQPLESKTEILCITVPTHTRTRGNDHFMTSEVSLPFLYKDINSQIHDATVPGTLVLIACGSIGKIFCETARARIGVALDIGSMVDYWAGVKTRSIADLV